MLDDSAKIPYNYILYSMFENVCFRSAEMEENGMYKQTAHTIPSFEKALFSAAFFCPQPGMLCLGMPVCARFTAKHTISAHAKNSSSKAF